MKGHYLINKELEGQNTDHKNLTADFISNAESHDETGKSSRIGSWEYEIKKDALTWSDVIYQIYEVEHNYHPTLESAITFFTDASKLIISEALKQFIVNGKSYDINLQLTTAKKNKIWVRAIGQSFYVNGKIVKIGGLFKDITNRKYTEQKLVIANNKLLFENTEKDKRASELIIANNELDFQNE